jgi:hypothetical protein
MRVEHGLDHCALGDADPRRQALRSRLGQNQRRRRLVEIHGIRATRTATGATRIELPTFRDATGQSRAAIVLPEEIYGPIGDAVLEVLIERGIAKRRFATPHLEQLSAQSS